MFLVLTYKEFAYILLVLGMRLRLFGLLCDFLFVLFLDSKTKILKICLLLLLFLDNLQV